MKKVLVATEKPFAKEAVEGIKDIVVKAGYEFELLVKYTAQSDFIEAAKTADAIIIRSDKADKDVIAAAQNLKIIVRAGAGYDNIDLAAATQKGIVAMNTPGQNSNAVAELVLGMMVYMARNKYNGKAGTELRGKTLGIHAYGHIGKLVAALGKAFGMDVYAFDPFVDKAAIEADGVKVVDSVEALYATCQYVSLHIPANDKTKNSINYDLMTSMPKGAVIVNTARKEVICEDSLKKAYADRADFAYISDIQPACAAELQEQYPERTFFTPKKSGAQTSEANINAGLAAANQIVNFLENGDVTFKVN